MYKSLSIALAAAMLAIVSNAAVVTEAMLESNQKGGIARAVCNLSIADAKAELAAIKNKVMSAPDEVKSNYAMALTIIYGRENPKAAYQQMVEFLAQSADELKIPAKVRGGSHFKNIQVAMVHRWYCGSVDESRVRDCLAANQNVEESSFEQAQLMGTAPGYTMDQRALLYRKSNAGRNHAMMWYLGKEETFAQGAELFMMLLLNGKLESSFALDAFTKVLPYELSREGADNASLKKKLGIGMLNYQAKARQWTGDAAQNPWLAFVGALGDAVDKL